MWLGSPEQLDIERELRARVLHHETIEAIQFEHGGRVQSVSDFLHAHEAEAGGSSLPARLAQLEASGLIPTRDAGLLA